MAETPAKREAPVSLVARLPRDIHRAARLMAFQQERSLNSVIVEAVARIVAEQSGPASQGAPPRGH